MTEIWTRVVAAARIGIFPCLVLLMACLHSGTATAAAWTASVDQRQGLPVLSKGGADVLSGTFVFWGKNWAWAGQQLEFKVVAPLDYALSAKISALGVDLAGRAKSSSSRQLVWEFTLEAHRSLPDVIGGGISFAFDVARFGAELGEPELLAGGRGWTWGRAGGSRVEMRFDPPLAAINFEGRKKSEIRAFFYSGEIAQGTRRHTATLSLSGDMAIGPTIAERFGMDDQRAWAADMLDWKTAPVDLSFLNAPEKPAGKRGFLKASGDRLVFGDGRPVRFWGTNLTANALFGTPKDEVKRQARRLSELGFNLVRLHHHDSLWVNPNIFGDRKSDTQGLNPAMLEKLDWWIKCLRDEGIYIWLDLHVGRQFRVGDGIEEFSEISKGKPTAELKGYNYVSASIRQAMMRFNEAYLGHLNPHTGVRYKDEPAIVALMITNENDLTQHYGNALLPDKNVPRINALYMAQAEAFAAKHALPKDKVWRAWEPGPSKLFLNDLEQRFNAEMIAHLRALGARVPIATTSTWGGNPLSSLPALTAGDIVDAHAYGGVGELEKNPLYAPNLVHWIAAAQVAGKPLAATEWNVERFPVPDRHSVPLYVAASARLQGWDAVVQYAYAQIPLNGPGTPSNWHAFNDPAMIAALPAAALLYRRGDVQEARTIYAYSPGKDQLFGQSVSADNSVALRTAAEKGRLVIALPQVKELPWLEKVAVPEGATILTDPNQSLIPGNADGITSDGGELRRNWAEGTYTIDTARTQAATGWLGGKKIRLADVDVALSTRNATVAVQSLSENPIRSSRAILISLGARAVPASESRLPFYSEPIEGRLAIRAPGGLKLYTPGDGLAPSEGSPYKYAKTNIGQARREIPASYKDGQYFIELGRNLGTYWLVLR